MMRVYIAGPYSSDPVAGIRAAVAAADELLAAGHTPHIPHLTHLWHLISPHPYEDWLALDLKWLEACGALVRLPGESAGADKEVGEAAALGIPIFTGVARFLEAAR
jgi:hypothetical protein